jgi:DUF971 family protein
MIRPLAITNHQRSRALQIDWADERGSHLPHALLRANCPCAQCTQLRRSGSLPDTDPAVELLTLEPVGEHGLSFAFSDGHARGIYPWVYLHALGANAPA